MLLYQEKVTPAFAEKVIAIADKYNLNPNWIMVVINFETSGTFSPSIKNPYSSATGLIQFLESTANELGTTTAALARMTAIEQLDYVDKYIGMQVRRHGTIDNVGEMYLAVFYPASISWSMDKVFSPSVYLVNKVFDGNKDGQITKQEVVDAIIAKVPATFAAAISEKKLYE